MFGKSGTNYAMSLDVKSWAYNMFILNSITFKTGRSNVTQCSFYSSYVIVNIFSLYPETQCTIIINSF